MKIDPKKAILDGVSFLSSPHCNERPENTSIDLLVIHGISLPPAQFGTGVIEQFFCGQLDASAHPFFEEIAALKVSAHLLISRTGVITQFVPFSQRAWHAGVSVFAGKENCNDFSIGIELEGTDEIPYEQIQYEQLAKTIKCLQNTYPGIVRERIVGHSDIAPGRKTDPGPSFDWVYLDKLLNTDSENSKLVSM